MADQLQSYISKLPADLLLELVAKIENPVDLINFALSYPDTLLCSRFNVFVLDAEKQLKLQENDPNKLTDLRNRPLLYAAIENGFSISVIEVIVRAYQEIHWEGMNSIWSFFPRALPPPVHFAAELARSDAVMVLLDLGCDPRLLYSDGPTGVASIDCDHQQIAHTQCSIQGRLVPRGQSACVNALETCIRTILSNGYCPDEDKHQKIEECALDLISRTHQGVSLDSNSTWLLSAAWGGMSRLITIIVGSLFGEDDGDTEKAIFHASSYEFLREVAMKPNRDGLEEVIEFLGNLGGPQRYFVHVEDSTSGNPSNLALETLRSGNPRNAASLLRVSLPRRVGAWPLSFTWCAQDDTNLSFTQQFYHSLGDGHFAPFMDSSETPYFCQGLLLGEAVQGGASKTCEWLFSQGLPAKGIHAIRAIEKHKLGVLEAVIGAGYPVNGIGVERPLQAALLFANWDAGIYLLSQGADPSLVSEDAKKGFRTVLPYEFGMSYSQLQKFVKAEMLTPEFFADPSKSQNLKKLALARLILQ